MFATTTRRAIPRTVSSFRNRPLEHYRFNSRSAVHNGDAELLETEKRRNLEKIQHLTSTPHEGAPGWNEYLASTSEAFIKADRYGQDGPPTSEMADRTVEHVTKRHSMPMSSREEASYERDEVEGPLKTSAAGATEVVEEDVDIHNHHQEKVRRKNMTRSEEDVKADRGELGRV